MKNSAMVYEYKTNKQKKVSCILPHFKVLLSLVSLNYV